MFLHTRFGDIFYRDKGEGVPLVFIHGYLETSDIFDSICSRLIHNYRIIRFDLLGHGKSDEYRGDIFISDFSDILHQLLVTLKIKKCMLVGHSLGGYILLEYLARNQHMVMGVILLHSHPFADDDEKIKLRDKEISFVEKGKRKTIIKFSIPLSFYSENLDRFGEKILDITQKAYSISVETMVQILKSMKSRKDHSPTLKNTNVPVLIIVGRFDEQINHERMQMLDTLNPLINIKYLENSGHMGFIEEEEKCIEMLQQYFSKISGTGG